MTGRGLGYCVGNDAPGFAFQGGFGGGRGRGGFGGGRGRGFGRGFGGGQRWQGQPAPMDSAEMLARRADALQAELADIRRQLDQLAAHRPQEED
jgi:hypothetical protein